MVLAAIYAQWGATTAVTAIFAGLAPAVLAIVAQAVGRIGNRSLKNPVLVGIAVAAFVALFVFDLAFPILIAAAGLVGYLVGRTRPELFAAAVHDDPAADTTPPLIADDALHGEHPSFGRALRLLLIGLPLWAAPVVAAALLLGGDHVVVDEGRFFSGVAVVTFGGAYAVLSYVAQRAVEVYGWLRPGEMVNGLALAETTPGPLIMVVQFVGFLGAYRNPGDLDPWVAGVIGATVVVWVTFVPCFLFVFLGAPHIERLRHNTALSAALSGITAAVVGVIANLSLFFAIHTLFADTRTYDAGPIHLDLPIWSTLGWRALAVSVLAFVLVFRLRWSVLRVLGVCAVVGAALHIAAT
jgi:chromate transporter